MTLIFFFYSGLLYENVVTGNVKLKTPYGKWNPTYEFYAVSVRGKQWDLNSIEQQMALIIAVYVFKRPPSPSAQMVYVSSKLLLTNRIMLEMDDQNDRNYRFSINFTGERVHLVT